MTESRAKTLWLVGLAILILLIISVGGVTRLTRSGLSIAEWKPVVGILPPLTNEAWEREFGSYRTTVEFQKVNSHFELDDYKKIYFWEYLHRVLGRLIFLYILLPGLFLWRKSLVEGRLLFTLVALVAVQGIMGWLMVKSGLNTEPRVSPYLLAVHFSLALSVLVSARFFILKKVPRIQIPSTPFKRFLVFLLGIVIAVQVIYGCLVSGMKAGHVSSTFPLMNGKFIPPEMLYLTPWWKNPLENPLMVQWIHRWIGIATVFLVYWIGYSFVGHLKKADRVPFFYLIGALSLQALWGVLLLVWHVPISLALTHQMFAALIVLAYSNLIFRIQLRDNLISG